MSEITSLLDHLNPTIAGAVVLVLIVLTLSKRLAELEGSFRWVGFLARAWNERQIRKVRRDAELDQAKREERDAAYRALRSDFESINTEVASLRALIQQQRSDHDDELEAARLEHRAEIAQVRAEHNAEMASMRRELDGKNSYIVRLLQWGHINRAEAAAQGFTMQPMPEENQ